jgi:hypothetical protein
MRTDGQTYMTKLTVAFRNFANASKNDFECAVLCAKHSFEVTKVITNLISLDFTIQNFCTGVVIKMSE